MNIETLLSNWKTVDVVWKEDARNKNGHMV